MKTISIPRESAAEGSLILVNGQYPYRGEISEKSYLPTRCSVSISLERRAAILLSTLMDDIGGWSHICAISGWRSNQEQQAIYERSLRENGTLFTEQYVARPNHSEHHTGLAIDLGKMKRKIDFVCPDFPCCGICQVFREKATTYGFIERYPKGKEQITGIAYEPWHFRYVGAPHAAIMTERGLALEEYHKFLKGYPKENPLLYRNGDRKFAISYTAAESDACTKLEIDDDIPYLISGNNTDGFILTEWTSKC